MAIDVSGSRRREPRLEVYGTLGRFESPGSSVAVHFLSCIASNRDVHSSEFELLKELKPMRERVQPRKLKSLQSLLQRDLNDFRVAEELVPYLLGKRSRVVFFPSVLAVIAPKDYLEDETISYPRRGKKKDSKEEKIDYDGFWEYETLTVGGQPSGLGLISISQSKSTLLVLDGQHRASAARAAAGLFPPKDGIYSAFYETMPSPAKFDLPVTLVWFDAAGSQKESIDSQLISRQLFVDVNNSARPVSESRTLLLEDYEITSLTARFLYDWLAENRGFDLGKLSLVHSAFDLDGDTSEMDANPLSLFAPQMIRDAVSWLLVGTNYYIDRRELYRVSRERNAQYKSVFERLLPDFPTDGLQPFAPEEEQSGYRLAADEYRESLREHFIESCGKHLVRLFDELDVFRPHFEAANNTGTEYENDAAMSMYWREVFLGGEGLCYSAAEAGHRRKAKTPSLAKLTDAIAKISKHFDEQRSSLFVGSHKAISISEVHEFYESTRTKAFVTALFMTWRCLRIDFDKSGEEASRLIVESLNSMGSDKALIALYQIGREGILESRVDPKAWPTYMKMILRCIQHYEPSIKYFETQTKLDRIKWPEGQLRIVRLHNRLESLLEIRNLKKLPLSDSQEYREITDDLSQSLESIGGDVDKLFKSAGLKPISLGKDRDTILSAVLGQ